MSHNFHICLRSEPRGADPPSPYGQPDCKLSVFFKTPLSPICRNRAARAAKNQKGGACFIKTVQNNDF